MGMTGADIAQMEQLERTLSQESGAVKELQTRITNTLNSTNWTGPAAERFKQEWNENFSRALNTLSDALGQNAAAVKNRTEAFRAAAG